MPCEWVDKTSRPQASGYANVLEVKAPVTVRLSTRYDPRIKQVGKVLVGHVEHVGGLSRRALHPDGVYEHRVPLCEYLHNAAEKFLPRPGDRDGSTVRSDEVAMLVLLAPLGQGGHFVQLALR